MDIYSVRPDGTDSLPLAATQEKSDNFKALTRAGRVVYELFDSVTNINTIHTIMVDGSEARSLSAANSRQTFGTYSR
jgi:hypothetical protein